MRERTASVGELASRHVQRLIDRSERVDQSAGGVGPYGKAGKVAICICAHNEAQTIGNLLESLTSSRAVDTGEWPLYVMTSACSDGTLEIVRAFGDANPLVGLTILSEPSRSGKVFSVNRFVESVNVEIAIFMDADICIEPASLEALVSALESDERAGIAVARRRSLEPPNSFWGFCENVQATLHNSLPPKPGRLYAIRLELAHVDEQSPADDTFQEWSCWAAGMDIVRAEAALVSNAGPRSIGDYLGMRRRVLVLHANLFRRTRYRPATMRRVAVVKAAWPYRRHKYLLPTLGMLSLEAVALLLAIWDVKFRGRNYVIWPVVESTKRALLT